MNALITGEGAHVFQLGTTWNPQYPETGGLVEIDINEFGGADRFFAANLESKPPMVNTTVYPGLLKQEYSSTTPRCLKKPA